MADREFLKSMPKAAFLALPLLIAPAVVTITPDAIAVAQTGGGGTSGGTGSGAGTGGSPGAGASPGGAGAVSPGTTTEAGTARGSGETGRPGALRGTPRTGVPPVPSAGNAEPSSPINRQDRAGAGQEPATRTPRPEAVDPGTRSPQIDPLLGGSGGTARTDGASGARPLDPAPSSDGASDGTVGSEPVEERQSGGGGPTLADCMDAWDAGTNMSRQDWRKTCERLGR